MPDPIPIPTPELPPAFSRAWWLYQGKMILPTNWREVIRWFILAAVIWLINLARGPDATPIPTPGPIIPVWEPPPDGWQPPTPEERQATLDVLQIARFSDTEAGQVVGADGDAPVWRLAAKGRGKQIPPRAQLQLGSCVSFGFVDAGEHTAAAQVAIGKIRQDLPDFAQEIVYGGSRVEVNGGRCPIRPDRNGNNDGSTGAWAAKWLETLGGYLPRGTYGSHNLVAYNVSRCKQWGDRGVPDELEPECRKHKARCTLVSTTEEAKSSLSQGYAIAICSDVGFQSGAGQDGKPTRDAEGFLRAQGNWGHCMSIVGYRADRKGFLIKNSWGPDWVKGPKGSFDDIPDGSFWAEERDVARILSQRDSYAVANADGFLRRKINPNDWIVSNPTKPHRLMGAFENAFALAP